MHHTAAKSTPSRGPIATALASRTACPAGALIFKPQVTLNPKRSPKLNDVAFCRSWPESVGSAFCKEPPSMARSRGTMMAAAWPQKRVSSGFMLCRHIDIMVFGVYVV